MRISGQEHLVLMWPKIPAGEPSNVHAVVRLSRCSGRQLARRRHDLQVGIVALGVTAFPKLVATFMGNCCVLVIGRCPGFLAVRQDPSSCHQTPRH